MWRGRHAATCTYLILKTCLCLRPVALLLLCKGCRELALLAVSLQNSRGRPAGCDRSWQLPDNGRWAWYSAWLCRKVPPSSQESLLYSKEFGIWHLRFKRSRLGSETISATGAGIAMFLEPLLRL